MKDRHEFVRDCLLKAGSDIKVALREMAAEDPALDVVCFHFQQYVEKMLKAWLSAHGVEYKPTHNLEILLVACERLDSSFSDLYGIQKLTPYATSIRYADDFYFPDKAEVEEAAQLAQNAGTFIQNKLKAQGFDIEYRREETER